MNGKAIVLVGVSSVGKTSVAEQLQLALREPYLHVGLDHFLSMFPYEWETTPRQPGPGLWVDKTPDIDGSPNARIYYGQAGERLLTGHACRRQRTAGDRQQRHPRRDARRRLDHARVASRPARWLLVMGATDGLAPCSRGPRAGGTRGQQPGNSRGHFDVQAGEEWDLVIDTDDLTPSETAAQIVKALGIVD